MFAEIKAVGSYLPENIVTNDDLSKFLDTSDDWITSRTGISERRITTGENTSDLCVEAAKKILNKAGLFPVDLDMIIVATISPDFLTPSTACIVQEKIGAVNAFAFDISAACSGFVYALSIADKYIGSGMCKHVLVLGAEVLSKTVDWQDRSTAVLFGDGAGGVLLSVGDKNAVLAEDLKADGSKHMALTSGFIPLANTFAPTVAMNSPYLAMDGRAIYDFVLKNVPQSIRTVLDKAQLTLDDISYIVPHQANYRLVEAVAKKLKVDMDKFYMNINKYANTSGATIPICLAEMWERNLLSCGMKIVITGFGAGLTWGSILLQI